MSSDNNVSWQSVKWPDGSTYEGLVKGDVCHVRGVFKYSGGDRYEGEYQENHMDGFGVYVWRDGTIYRGMWNKSMMNGCGVKITRQPNGQFVAEEGQFVNDEWVGDVMACTVDQARAAAAESDIAAQMARVFEVHDAGKQAGVRLASGAPAASLSHSSHGSVGKGKGRGGPTQQLAAQGQATAAAAAASSEGSAPRQRGGPLGFLAGLLGRR